MLMAPILLPCSILALVAFFAQGALSQHDKPATTSLSSNATCPARTANYITHTLPQLCLTSSRAVPTNTTSGQADYGFSSSSSEASSAGSYITTTAEQPSPTSSVSSAVASSSIPAAQDSEASTRPVQETGIKTVGQDIDSDSELGSARFLSFEEWKRQNLAKSGQSEHIGKARHDDLLEPRRKPAPVSDALDALGEDTEIDLDFAGFAAEKPDVAPPGQNSRGRSDGEGANREEATAPVTSKPTSTDAGTTCKERFNYASFDCAATVLKTNPQAKGSSAVLSENKDSYMLNECSAESKFLILELCNDISIDTVVLANFEFFSSIFRTFRVSVSDRYPVKAEKWKTLGTFEARNSRDVQAFLVENPLIWARYLKIEFLTHYGSEYYCPVSLIRVHGTTMMEDYKHDMDANRAEDDEHEEGASNPLDDFEPLIPEAVAEVLIQAEEARSQALSQPHSAETVVESQSISSPSQPKAVERPDSPKVDTGLCPYDKTKENMLRMAAAFNISHPICTSSGSLTELVAKTPTAAAHMLVQENETSPEPPPIHEHVEASGLPLITSNASSALDPTPQTSINESAVNATHALATTTDTETLMSNSRGTAPQTTNATHVEHTKSATSSTQPSLASPTIQESFFKSVQKRLQMLESNSSLSLQYIEEQSRNLRDAFGRVEQRQLSKTSSFLEYLNTTVLSELRDFRQQYDQLWQSTVIELDTQREQYQKEVLAINSRLAVLADEVIFQKRMSILQSILVLICLGLVLFSRGAMNNYLELPIVQNMLARSPSLRRLNSQILRTPTESPATTRPSSSHKQNPPYGILKSHRSQVSEDSVVRPPSPTITYSPPTPTSFEVGSDIEEMQELHTPESPPPEHDAIMRPSSSPPAMPGSEDQQAENWNGTETTGLPLTNDANVEPPTRHVPSVTVEEAMPPAKHLSFRLPGA